MAKLTDKQRRFCEEYVSRNDIVEAVIQAGYSESTATRTGKSLLQNPEVKKHIKSLKANAKKKQSASHMEGNTYASKFDMGIVHKICDTIASSDRSTEAICVQHGISEGTFRNWRHENEEVLRLYARAKEQQADFMAEQIIQISDDSSNDTIQGEYGPLENREWVNRSKLRVDSRKWLASKLAPKKYGDKIDHNIEGEMKITQITGMQIS